MKRSQQPSMQFKASITQINQKICSKRHSSHTWPQNLHSLLIPQSKSDHLCRNYGRKTISAFLPPWLWRLSFQPPTCSEVINWWTFWSVHEVNWLGLVMVQLQPKNNVLIITIFVSLTYDVSRRSKMQWGNKGETFRFILELNWTVILVDGPTDWQTAHMPCPKTVHTR